jgi:hypothetical protein
MNATVNIQDVYSGYKTSGLICKDQLSKHLPSQTSQKVYVGLEVPTNILSKDISSISDKEIDIQKESVLQDSINRINQAINDLRKLKDNWNGYESAAPNRKALDIAEQFVYHFHNKGLYPNHVAPSVEEGVAFSFSRENKYAIIECYNDGEIAIALHESGKEPKVWEISFSDSEIQDALEEINLFINEA